MPRASNIWSTQSNGNMGETTPLFLGRNDVELYYNSLKYALNIAPSPTGSMMKRNGTEFVLSVPYGQRLEKFSFNTEQEYLLLIDCLINFYRMLITILKIQHIKVSFML